MREYASTRPLRQALRVAGGESEPADRTTAQQVGQGGRLTNPRPRRSRRSLRSGPQIALPALSVQVLPVVGNRSSRVLIFANLVQRGAWYHYGSAGAPNIATLWTTQCGYQSLLQVCCAYVRPLQPRCSMYTIC